MPDVNDMELVRGYSQQGSEEAFAELVQRHITLVYSVALRHVGIAAQAEEITQAVFVILSRKAARLRPDTILEGWLYETTRLTSLSFLRGERRRQFREQEAYMQSTLQESTDDLLWNQLAPLLDEAMSRLGKKDRDAVILRFFKEKSVREVAATLQVNETTAQRRILRAVEKLQTFFLKRGVTSTAATLAGAISANSVHAAPMALAKTATAVALAKGATASISTLTLIKGALKIMAWTKAKTAIVSIVIVGIATFSVIQHQAQVKLREQNEALQQQMAKLQTENARLSIKPAQTPHLPAPQMQMPIPAALPKEDLQTTNLFGRFKDNAPKLTAEQIEAYLKANGRKASSLLAAYRTSGDPALLKEAMEKFPNDPQVEFEAALDKDLSPDEQRQWLNTFEKSAPNNALANYLSALNYFNSGQIDQGVQELTAASGKPLDDYTLNRMQDDEEAYTSAGYSAAEAERIADAWLVLPQDVQEKQLGLDLVALANAYGQSGDQNSAQAALQMAMNFGQNVASESSNAALLNQLVGMSIETLTFNAMNPNSSYGNNGQTVQDQLNLIAQQKVAINELVQQAEPLMPAMSDQDILNYENRRKLFGEVAALQWLVSKYGQH